MALVDFPLIQDLTPVDQARFLGRLDRRQVAGGEVLFRQGDPGDALLLVVSGSLEVLVRDAQGQDRLLAQLGRGESLGEMALLSGEPRSATVRAAEASEIFRLDRANFDELVQRHPALAQYFLRLLCRRLNQNNAQRAGALASSAAFRLAVAARFGEAVAADLETAAEPAPPASSAVAPEGSAAPDHAATDNAAPEPGAPPTPAKAPSTWRPRLLNAVSLGAALALVAWGWFGPPLPGLDPEGQQFLGLVGAALVGWMRGLWPDYIVSLGLVLSWVAAGLARPEQVLAGFASETWLFLVLALLLGFALNGSGLVYRAALNLLRWVPRRPTAQLGALGLLAALINPLIPSGLTKGLLAAPLSVSLAEALDLKPRSRGRAGLVLGSFLLFVYMNPFFLSAGLSNFFTLGLVPGSAVDPLTWTLWSLPALAVFTGAVILFARLYMGPSAAPPREAPAAVGPGTADPGASPGPSGSPGGDMLQEQLRLLGPMRRAEWATLGALALILTMQLTAPWHGLGGAWALAAGILLLAGVNLLGAAPLKQIDFAMLLNLGLVLSLAGIAQDLGVDRWLAAPVAGLLAPLNGNPTLILPLLGALILALGFVLDAVPAMALAATTLIPVWTALGWHPWLLVFLILLTTGPFFLPYQSEIYLAVYYAAEEQGFSHRQGRIFALFYALLALALLVLSLPFWTAWGLLGPAGG